MGVKVDTGKLMTIKWPGYLSESDVKRYLSLLSDAKFSDDEALSASAEYGLKFIPKALRSAMDRKKLPKIAAEKIRSSVENGRVSPKGIFTVAVALSGNTVVSDMMKDFRRVAGAISSGFYPAINEIIKSGEVVVVDMDDGKSSGGSGRMKPRFTGVDIGGNAVKTKNRESDEGDAGGKRFRIDGDFLFIEDCETGERRVYEPVVSLLGKEGEISESLVASIPDAAVVDGSWYALGRHQSAEKTIDDIEVVRRVASVVTECEGKDA